MFFSSHRYGIRFEDAAEARRYLNKVAPALGRISAYQAPPQWLKNAKTRIDSNKNEFHTLGCGGECGAFIVFPKKEKQRETLMQLIISAARDNWFMIADVAICARCGKNEQLRSTMIANACVFSLSEIVGMNGHDLIAYTNRRRKIIAYAEN